VDDDPVAGLNIQCARLDAKLDELVESFRALDRKFERVGDEMHGQFQRVNRKLDRLEKQLTRRSRRRRRPSD
jgi:hypothetical protein